MDSARWTKIGTVAARQWAVVSFEQLTVCGFSAGAIQRAVGFGQLVRLHKGVFALAHRPIDRRGHLMGAMLSCGPGACISHLPAGEHLGILPVRQIPQLEVTVPRGAGLRSRKKIRIHRAAIGGDECMQRDRIHCTTPSRALLDIAADHPHRLERAMKKAGERELLSVDLIVRLLDRYPRRPGGPLLRSMLDLDGSVPVFTRSELERRVYRLCRASSIELPVMNVPIDAENGPYEVDCVWLRQRLIIECDSRHHDNPRTSAADALRDQALTLAGWRVERMRWVQIVGDPERASRTIRHLLREQERLLRSGPAL